MRAFERRPAVATLLLFAVGCAVSASIAGLLVYLDVLRAPWLEDVERAYELRVASSGAQRILVLGDSFLAPWNTDPHLKKDLDAYASERGIGLVNEARHGLGPASYYAHMQKLAAEFEPGLVLIFYFVGNDLTDVQYHVPKFQPTEPAGAKPITIDPGCRIAFPRKRRAGGKFDWDAMSRHGIDPALVEMARSVVYAKKPPDERINPWLLTLAMSAPRYLLDNILMDTECNAAAWQVSAAFLTEIFAIARRVGADVQLIAIPSTVQLDRSHFDVYRRSTLQVDDRLLESTRPQELLSELCARHDVPFLDLLPYFERHPDPASLYWRFDPHFSSAGHRLAFEILREEVLDPWVARNRPGGAVR
jgi:hypothetical protein